MGIFSMLLDGVSSGMAAISRMKLLVEYNNLAKSLSSGVLNPLARMKSLVRVNQIRVELGAGKVSPPVATIPVVNPDVAILSAIASGSRDAEDLGILRSDINDSINRLNSANQLIGETDKLANDTLTKWVHLDEAKNR